MVDVETGLGLEGIGTKKAFRCGGVKKVVLPEI
jgi:hypothetical protein